MSEDSGAPKKKRGRPKGSKNKTTEEKAKEVEFDTPLGETKPKPAAEAPAPEKKEEKPVEKAEAKPEEEKKEETAVEKKEEESEKPKPKEYTPEEIEEIAKRVETYSDQTPPYKPTHMLSPDFEGTSNYEVGIKLVRDETEQKLQKLQGREDEYPEQIRQAKEDLKTLDYLYENFNIGMNVFRTAKGGREKLRE